MTFPGTSSAVKPRNHVFVCSSLPVVSRYPSGAAGFFWLAPMNEKTCTACRETKPDDAFRLVKLSSGGYSLKSACKACEVAYRKEHRYAMKPPPCWTCEHATYCAKTGSTCRAFDTFVLTGQVSTAKRWRVPGGLAA